MRYFLIGFASLMFLSGCATTQDKQCAQNQDSQECQRKPSNERPGLNRQR